MNAPDGEEEAPSLAAMVEKLRKGEPVDHDVLLEELVKAARGRGIPGTTIGRLMGRARWDAERRAENRADPGPVPEGAKGMFFDVRQIPATLMEPSMEAGQPGGLEENRGEEGPR